MNRKQWAVNSSYSEGFRIFLSAPQLGVSFIFGCAMLLLPVSFLPGSYEFMFSILPKSAIGCTTLLVSLLGYWSVIAARRGAWRIINGVFAAMFFGLASLFLMPGSITGASAYSVIAGYSLLHTFDRWLPIGFLVKR